MATTDRPTTGGSTPSVAASDAGSPDGREQPRSRSAAISDGLAFMARWSLRLALIGLGLALLWWVIARIWVIVMPVLLALLITTVLWPPAAWLRRRGTPPALAAAAVLLVALVVLGLIIFAIANSITGGVGDIATNAVAGLQSIQNWIAGPPLNIGSSQFNALLEQVTSRHRRQGALQRHAA